MSIIHLDTGAKLLKLANNLAYQYLLPDVMQLSHSHLVAIITSRKCLHRPTLVQQEEQQRNRDIDIKIRLF